MRAVGPTGGRRGVTLIEMLIVMALIGLLVTVSLPAVSAGVDSLRLSSAGDAAVSFLNAALNRAERRQEVMEVTISKDENAILLRSTEPGYERKLEMPAGVTIVSVLPPLPQETGEPRRFMLYPGGTIPSFGVELSNRKGAGRIVRIDPVTGVPQVERVEVR